MLGREISFAGIFGLLRLTRVSAAGLALLLPLATEHASAQQQAVGRQVLAGHFPPEFARAPVVGPLDQSLTLSLAIGLPVRSESELDALIHDISNPKSSQFRHFLTPAQFAERFGPTQQDYDAVVAFANTHGLTVTQRFINRLAVGLNGTVAAVNEAFHIQLTTRQRPDGSPFYAPDREPSVDLDTRLLDVSGLDDYVLPQRGIIARRPALPPSAVVLANGSGPDGRYGGTDFRNAYANGVDLTGAGQSVGLFELDGFYTHDVALYVAKFKDELTKTIPVAVLAQPPFKSNDQQSGPPRGGCHPKSPLPANTPAAGTPGGSNDEVALDIDMAMSMAPGLDHIYVFEGCNPDLVMEAMTEPQNGGLPMQLSASWTYKFTAIGAAANKAMAALGQTFLVIAGDHHATCPGGNTTSSRALPYVTVVGGTILLMNGDGSSWDSEIGAEDGGGMLNGVPMPDYQAFAANNVGDTSWRAIPDVSMVSCDGDADYPQTKGKCSIFIYDNNGVAEHMYGTSIAAPLWAGYLALVNQYTMKHGATQPGLGFINPALYGLAVDVVDFHDITAGTSPKNPGKACDDPVSTSAKQGYDLITGLGSPTAKLISDLGFVPSGPSTPPSTNPCAGTDEIFCEKFNRCVPRNNCTVQSAKPPSP